MTRPTKADAQRFLDENLMAVWYEKGYSDGQRSMKRRVLDALSHGFHPWMKEWPSVQPVPKRRKVTR